MQPVCVILLSVHVAVNRVGSSVCAAGRYTGALHREWEAEEMGQRERSRLRVWNIAGPMLLYFMIHDMTIYLCQSISGGSAGEQLWVSGLGSAIAAVPLGIWYRRLRQESRIAGMMDAGTAGAGMRDARAEAAGMRTAGAEAAGMRPAGAEAAGLQAADVSRIGLLAVGSCVLFNNLIGVLDQVTEGFERTGQLLGEASLTVQVLCIGLIIPLAEELVFRGFLYGQLRRVRSPGAAALVSAVCFGIYHGNLAQGIYAACLGLILAVLYEHYDSLAAVWLYHGAANLTSVFLTATGFWMFQQKDRLRMTVVTIIGGILMAGSAYKIKKGKKTT